MNVKTEKQLNKSIDTSNNLEQSVDLLHIQGIVIDDLVAYANEKHNDRLEMKLDDLMTLNKVIAERINKQSSVIVNRSIAKIHR